MSVPKNKEDEYEFDLNLVDNVEFDGVNEEDYPDFADAFIYSADYGGSEMTEEEIDALHEQYPDWVYSELMNHLY